MPTTITDSFTRADATTLGITDTGETWAYAYPLGNPGSSYFGIVGNKAYTGQPAGGSSNEYQAYVPFGAADQKVTFVPDWGNHGTPHLSSRPGVGVMACFDPSSQTGIQVQQTTILRMTGPGTGTSIYTGANLYDYNDTVEVTVYPGATHTLVDLVVNGTTVVTGIDSGALLTGTNVGLLSGHAESLAAGGYPLWHLFQCEALPVVSGWLVGSIKIGG